MKAGDIIFVRGKTLISKVIQAIDGEFSHVAIAISETHILESQGIVDTRIVPFYFKDYEIVDMGLSTEQVDQLIHFGINTVGLKYDYGQIIGIYLKKMLGCDFSELLNRNDRMICSELVDIVLYAVGAIPKDIYLGDKTPNELYHYLKSLTKLQ